MVLTAVSLDYRAMDEVWILTLLSLAMLAGCYLAGTVPLVVSMSEVSNLGCCQLKVLHHILKCVEMISC